MHFVVKSLVVIAAVTVCKKINIIRKRKLLKNSPKRFILNNSIVEVVSRTSAKTPQSPQTGTTPHTISVENNAPSAPHRTTPQTLPVSPSENAQTSSGQQLPARMENFKNEALAHRMILDPSYRIPEPHPQEPQGSAHRQVTETMKAAYWDMLRSQAQAGEYALMMENLGEVKSRLGALLPQQEDRRLKMSRALDAGMDLELVAQQLKHRVFDAASLLDLVRCAMQTILELEAPARNPSTQGWLKEMEQKVSGRSWEALLPQIFEEVHRKIEELSTDMTNWRLGQAAVWLQEHGVRFEQDRFQAKCQAGTLTLQVTAEWLRATRVAAAHTAALTAEDKALLRQGGSTYPIPKVLHSFGVLRLLCLPTALTPETCPEVLHLDIPQLVQMQNTLQAVTLVGAMLMIASALLAEKGARALTDQWGTTFRRDMHLLLAQPNVQVAMMQDYMATFLEKVIEEQAREGPRAEGGGRASLSSKLSDKDREFLSRMTDKTASLDDQFYSQMSRRVLGALWSALREETDAQSRQVLSTIKVSMKEEIAAMSGTLRKIVIHNFTVHSQRIVDLITSQQL